MAIPEQMVQDHTLRTWHLLRSVMWEKNVALECCAVSVLGGWHDLTGWSLEQDNKIPHLGLLGRENRHRYARRTHSNWLLWDTIMEAEQREDPDRLTISAGIVKGCWFSHKVTITSSVGIKCLDRPEWPSLASCGVPSPNISTGVLFMFTSGPSLSFCVKKQASWPLAQ